MARKQCQCTAAVQRQARRPAHQSRQGVPSPLQAASSPQEPPLPQFLRLPEEIRRLIYDRLHDLHAQSNDHAHQRATFVRIQPDKQLRITSASPLARVNKELYEQAKRWAYLDAVLRAEKICIAVNDFDLTALKAYFDLVKQRAADRPGGAAAALALFDHSPNVNGRRLLYVNLEVTKTWLGRARVGPIQAIFEYFDNEVSQSNAQGPADFEFLSVVDPNSMEAFFEDTMSDSVAMLR